MPRRAGAETASSGGALHRRLRTLPSGLPIEIYIVEKPGRMLRRRNKVLNSECINMSLHPTRFAYDTAASEASM